MGKCSIENCENKCFEREDKCILHCEKDQKNGWYTFDKDNKTVWEPEKVKLFWREIRNIISDSQGRLSKFLPIPFNNIVFPKFEGNGLSSNVLDYEDSFFKKEGEEKKFTQKVDFNSCTFLDSVDFTNIQFKKDIVFSKCILKDEIKFKRQQDIRISFLACPEIESLDFSKIVFEQKVEIKECTINSCNFEDTRFKDFCDFEESTFNAIKFKNTVFEKLVTFQKTKFTENVDFYYVTFKTHSIFKNTIFEKTVNFENTLFEVDGSFYGIRSKEDMVVANRETARIIKNSFEQQNNIIEANRFYALEMKKREKELKLFKNPFEWIVFKLHGISSDHSQSWFLALVWIFIISIIFSIYKENITLNKDLLQVSMLVGVISSIFLYCIRELKYMKHIFSFLILILLFINYFYVVDNPLDCLAKNLSILVKFDNALTFYELFFKITIAYLIYQFIVSVRQNTRRK
ncbi:MAG: pentapeptide repeat-containing protein [Arcobacteraceae bacterium]|nr:pentapeptide repeat-containing protein [Arcobacteraceae bacterium]